MTEPGPPDDTQGTDVIADPEHLEDHEMHLTTDSDQQRDDLGPDSTRGEGGSG